ncbi:hypothetical protein BJV82DRAFT_652707 [Fennellomyces sp. T-0311]|nr:hypothetical protein BJV82DRAFT_652707 [Fennellomyces sp. T-0311]
MHAQLGRDAAITFSSKFPEDHGGLTKAITNGNDEEETAGPALKRSTTAQKHEISNGMRKLLAEVSGSEVAGFPWKKFCFGDRTRFWYILYFLHKSSYDYNVNDDSGNIDF